MPTNRKKKVRARREKTGESYQSALRNLRGVFPETPPVVVGSVEALVDAVYEHVRTTRDVSIKYMPMPKDRLLGFTSQSGKTWLITVTAIKAPTTTAYAKTIDSYIRADRPLSERWSMLATAIVEAALAGHALRPAPIHVAVRDLLFEQVTHPTVAYDVDGAWFLAPTGEVKFAETKVLRVPFFTMQEHDVLRQRVRTLIGTAADAGTLRVSGANVDECVKMAITEMTVRDLTLHRLLVHHGDYEKVALQCDTLRTVSPEVDPRLQPGEMIALAEPEYVGRICLNSEGQVAVFVSNPQAVFKVVCDVVPKRILPIGPILDDEKKGEDDRPLTPEQVEQEFAAELRMLARCYTGKVIRAMGSIGPGRRSDAGVRLNEMVAMLKKILATLAPTMPENDVDPPETR